MLKFYLATVVIWMIIIWCVARICVNSIEEHGWLNKNKDSEKCSDKISGFAAIFIFAAVPFMRLLVVVFMFYMASHTEEQFEEWKAEQAAKKTE